MINNNVLSLALVVLAAVLLIPLSGILDQAAYTSASHRAAAAIGGGPGLDLATTLSQHTEDRSAGLEDLLTWLDEAGVDYEAQWIDSTAGGALLRVLIEYPLTTIDGVIDVDFAHGNIVRIDGSATWHRRGDAGWTPCASMTPQAMGRGIE